jgi:alanine-synthesizing transaminase
MYQDRRDVLCDGLNSIGWAVTPPKATMFVWAKIPEFYQAMGSLESLSNKLAKHSSCLICCLILARIASFKYSVPMR